MSLECPNCREPVNFFRAFRTTAWGSFPCTICGSILGVSLARRMWAVIIWLILFASATFLLPLQQFGPLVYIPTMAISILMCLYVCEDVVLLDRRSFTCKGCGYDLHGLTEARCPECGTGFDPTECERVQARINEPPPTSHRRKRIIAAILVVVVSMGIAAGFIAWRRAGGRAATAPPIAVSPSSASPDE